MNIAATILLVIYLLGAWRFLAGFDKTFYSSNRFWLTVLWPIFFAFSGRYRQEFFKALKGS
ncbi:MAG: hypothetical protein NZL92_00830 [Gloeomargarita sp. SKYG116]|nr:hypothetical protein [Gloeomargarita sp. SKYG116]MDW8400221.1 hypothetical protein [Gloeomargarita sp. SKYGB_i_bin116]